MRLAYCTGILRTAWVMTTTAAITPTISATTPSATSGASVPARILSNAASTAFGAPPRMFTKMMSEMPLPMPCSVIFSPSHMTRMVPAVCVMIVTSVKPKPGSGTTVSPRAAPMLTRNTLYAYDWITEMRMVP